MFTGLVWGTGLLVQRDTRGNDARLWLDAKHVLARREPALGDSVAVNGVCLTVVAREAQVLAFDVSAETLRLTTLGMLPEQSLLNLEPALTLADALGGHLVSGHVDATGRVSAIERSAESEVWSFEIPGELARFVAVKGSIAVDGVSLTVNAVDPNHRPGFQVTLIPHTLSMTAFRSLAPGAPINLEVDLMARYAARWRETGA